MPKKMVRLEENVYERIKSKKRDNETFSEAIDRLTSKYSLLEFAGGYTDEDAKRHRDLLDRAKETAVIDHRDHVDQVAEDE